MRGSLALRHKGVLAFGTVDLDFRNGQLVTQANRQNRLTCTLHSRTHSKDLLHVLLFHLLHALYSLDVSAVDQTVQVKSLLINKLKIIRFKVFAFRRLTHDHLQSFTIVCELLFESRLIEIVLNK